MASRNSSKKLSDISVTYGGWYQRTTLHLSEIYDFFAFGSSKLDLRKDELSRYRDKMALSDVVRESGPLESVKAKTGRGIDIRYYEDGLYALETKAEDMSSISEARHHLEEYYGEAMSPAISYLFSLGAPTPKILANIKTVHPTVICGTSASPEDFEVDEDIFGSAYSRVSGNGVSVIKTPLYIFVVTRPALRKNASSLIENLIFFREFKDHLEKYLNIHRSLWEDISAIKEKKSFQGEEVDEARDRLDQYQKTISLISNRINQMGAYARTRSAIAKNASVEEHLRTLFQFKFETLLDTLDYIKEIWKMTSNYLSSAIQNLVEIKGQTAAKGIQSLQVIMSLGVVAIIIGYISKGELPKITFIGLVYFALIIFLTWAFNKGIARFYMKKGYSLRFGERAEKI